MTRPSRLTPTLAAIAIAAAGLALYAATATGAPQPPPAAAQDASQSPIPAGAPQLAMPPDLMVANPERNADRNAYFGDLHVHTSYSFDAFTFGTLATPYDAYRYARGEAIRHPAGFELKLRTPLDFYAVTDHAVFLGSMKAAADTSTELSKLPQMAALHDLNSPESLREVDLARRSRAFRGFSGDILAGLRDGTIDIQMINGIAKSAWSDIIKAAEQFNEPGKLTTFVGYEYTTSSDDRGNLHRNVIFRGADKLPAMPFSRLHSQNPEGLWDWLDGLRAQGIEALAIPHNSNGSNGQMWKLVDWAGDPIDDEYAQQRLRNEPLIEITQVKGTSETHPALSMNDEWADFEIMPYRVATNLPSEPHGSYAREALLNGLGFADRGITNPYQFGFVAASDTHVAATTDDESNYFSKVGLVDGTPERRGSVPISPENAERMTATGLANIIQVDGRDYVSGSLPTFGASGLTGVWAEENTRDAIYDAFRRKETFATTGPRIRVRFFAGYDLDPSMLGARDMVARAYAGGVSMGSELPASGTRPPRFLVWALRDTQVHSAPLQRAQIVKGWTVDGEHHEQVYDVACSDGGEVDPGTHRCPDNGARVDLSDCSISEGTGATELLALWQDPDFDPAHRAFYYARILENPTCRWSTWDAVRAGVPPRSDLHATIQERAFTSPIWFQP